MLWNIVWQPVPPKSFRRPSPCVRHLDVEQPARSKDSPYLLQQGEWIGHVLEHMPERHAVKPGVGIPRVGEISDKDAVVPHEMTCDLRCSHRYLCAVDVGAPPLEPTERVAAATADIEDAPSAHATHMAPEHRR